MTDAEPRAGSAPADQRPQPTGSIRLMTDTPVPIDASEPALLAAARIQLSRRPWIAPAIVLGAAAAFLLLRNRR